MPSASPVIQENRITDYPELAEDRTPQGDGKGKKKVL